MQFQSPSSISILVRRHTPLSVALCAGLLVIATLSCTVSLLRFSVPPTVLAGAVFDITLTGAVNMQGALTDSVGAVLQLPDGFSVIDANAGTVSGSKPTTRDLPALLSLYTPEVGHYLASFSAQGSSDQHCLRVRVRAPGMPATYTIKAALAATTNGSWVASGPAPTTQFASISGANVTKSIVVTTSAAAAPTWQLNVAGVAGSNPPVPTTGVPFNFWDVDVAYADGDVYPDIVSGSTLDSTGMIVPMVQRGRFVDGWALNFPGTPQVGRARVGNFNGDPWPDVVFDRDIFLGNPGGSMTLGTPFAPTHQVNNPPPIGLAVGDVDGDGLDDIVRYEYAINVYRSLGNGLFAAANNGLPFSLTQTQIGAMDLVDLDGDGDLDIALGGVYFPLSGPILEMYLNDGTASWTAIGDGGLGLPNSAKVYGFAVADMNSDGLPDLLISRRDSGLTGIGITIYYAASPGVWTQVNSSTVTSDGTYTGIAVADVDADGTPDVIAVQTATTSTTLTTFGRVRIFRGLGGGAYGPGGTLETGFVDDAFRSTGRLLYRDVNRDGLADIVVASNTGVTVYDRVGPLHTSAYGNLGESVPSGPFSVLTVGNAAAPVGARAVRIPVMTPVTVSIAQAPTSMMPSRCVVWGRLDLPPAAASYASAIGILPFIPHTADIGNSILFTLVDSFVPTDPLAIFPGAGPGSYTRTIQLGIPFPMTYSLEGVIDDPSAPTGFARTNVVYVEVH